MRSRQLPDPHGRQFGNQISTSNTLFPSDARGYLYYHSPPSHSPLTGGLRFRVTEERSPEGFLAGHDLLMNHALPWHIPIWEIVSWSTYSHILKLLIQDGFAPLVLQRACKSLNVARDSVFIPALGVPWAVDWSWEFSRVYFVRQNHHPTPALVRHPWYARHAVRRAPYSGRGLVSVIKNSDGELCLRVEKVLNLKQHGVNHKTPAPVEGLVTPLSVRLIHKSTKISEEEMDQHSNRVLYPLSQLPMYPANPDPFDVYCWSENILQGIIPLKNGSSQTQAVIDPPPHLADTPLGTASGSGVHPSLPAGGYSRNVPTRPEPWAAPPPTEGSVWATGLSSRLRASRNAETWREARRTASPEPTHSQNPSRPDRIPRHRR